MRDTPFQKVVHGLRYTISFYVVQIPLIFLFYCTQWSHYPWFLEWGQNYVTAQVVSTQLAFVYWHRSILYPEPKRSSLLPFLFLTIILESAEMIGFVYLQYLLFSVYILDLTASKHERALKWLNPCTKNCCCLLPYSRRIKSGIF